jgi:DNA-directed RNA polymerase subunit RPC12/RpoP
MIGCMQSHASGVDAVLDFIFSLGFLTFMGVVMLWLIFAAAAWYQAPTDRRWPFMGLTLLFGPIGLFAAMVASPRDPDWFAAAQAERPLAKGRTRYWCARCGAQSDLVELKSSSCWRCDEKRFIAAKS